MELRLHVAFSAAPHGHAVVQAAISGHAVRQGLLLPRSALDVPVGRRTAVRASKMEPGLTVGSRRVVRQASVRRGHGVARIRVAKLPWAGVHAVRPTRRSDEGSTLTSIDLGESIDVLQLRASKVTVEVAATVASSTTVAATTAAAAVVRQRSVLSGEFRLNAFAVRRVADRGEDGTDALHQDHALGCLAVVEDGLDDVVAIGVAEELFEAGAVENLGHEGFADLGVGHADALFYNIGRESAW